MDSTKWSSKDLYTRRASGFLVEVSRHTALSESFGEGPNRWCIYAYIYPSHPHFSKFSGSSMWQTAATEMPFHGGPSYFRNHYAVNGNVTCVQVGCDYHHLGDDFYTHMATADDATSVFNDADQLFEWLLNYQEVTDGV